MTDPDGGLFTYGYDLAGRQTVQQNPLNQRTTWTYDDADRTTAEELANRARTSYVYDDAGRVTGLRNMDSSLAVLSSFTYTYDGVGNRTEVAEADGSRVSWTYDKTYQLTREHRTGGVSFDVTYTYDPAGNRLVQEDSGALTTYAYDAANELLTAEDSSGTTTFTYDATGNRRTKEERVVGVTTYAWDPQDRLVAVYKPSQRTFTFVYNAAGQRITRQTYAGQRKFVYDQNKPLLETDAGAQTTLTYDYSNRDAYGELLSRRHQGVTDFHQYDALGSTKHLLDEAQSPTDSYIYRAFGKVESKTGATENHQLYVGRFGYFAEEELGLYFLNARYYDLATGQFLSVDPIENDTNLYRYVGNSPTNAADPEGLWHLVKGSTSEYEADGGEDSLMGLSWVVTSQQGRPTNDDWVCIWPVGKKYWEDYPWAKKCAKADVSNLLIGKYKTKKAIMVRAPAKDAFANAVRLMLSKAGRGWNLSKWTNAKKAVELIRDAAKRGERPIQQMIIAGHSNPDETVVHNLDGSRPFAAGDIFQRSGLSNSSNTLENALQSHGPPRCWFTRDATVWALGCNTSAFAKAFAELNLRKGAVAKGTTLEVFAFWKPTGTGRYWAKISVDRKRSWLSTIKDVLGAGGGVWADPSPGGL